MKILTARKNILGDGHLDTLASIVSLSNTWWAQGRWEESESLDRQTMDLMKEKLGPEHLQTLASITNLAETLFSLDKFKSGTKTPNTSTRHLQENTWTRATSYID